MTVNNEKTQMSNRSISMHWAGHIRKTYVTQACAIYRLAWNVIKQETSKFWCQIL